MTVNRYFHGQDNRTGVHSCCKWGRGNGWALVAKADGLVALEAHPSHHPHARGGTPLQSSFDQVLVAFQQHATGVLAAQDPQDGRWHNILTDASSFLETSATAMFLTAFAVGMEHGWLDEATFGAPSTAAWNALVTQIAPGGAVTGIVGETGIGDDAANYDPMNVDFALAAPGEGAVLRGIAAYARWTQR